MLKQKILQVSILLSIWAGSLAMPGGGISKFSEEYIVKIPKNKEITNLNIIIQSQSRMFFVTQKNDTKKDIVIRDSYQEICRVNVNSTLLSRPLNWNLLGNGKIVFHEVERAQFIFIDPENCTASAVDEKILRTIPNSCGKTPIILTYYDTFDLFDRELKYCNPCRYNDRGEFIQLSYFLTPDKIKPDPRPEIENYQMSLSKLENPQDPDDIKYIYFTYFTILPTDFANYTTIIKLFNSKFEVIEEKLLPHSIMGFNHYYGHMSLCYTGCILRENCTRTICEFLNSKLETTVKVELGGLAAQETGVLSYPTSLSDGGAIVAQWLCDLPSEDDNIITLHRIHADGRLDEPIIQEKGRDGMCYSETSFLPSDSKYCSVCHSSSEKTGNYKVKCLDV